jgi:SAM-dependent methyltransferase
MNLSAGDKALRESYTVLAQDFGSASAWDQIGGAERPSWYLDPLVARQKQAVHLALIDRWAKGVAPVLLKTDVFEEANGSDQLLFQLNPYCEVAVALDLSAETVHRARGRCPGGHRNAFLVSDVRQIPLASNVVHLIVSNSTLDHFDAEYDFQEALTELVRVMAPGGRMIITVDNPLNVLYWPLRWISRLKSAPFPLGYTPTPASLIRKLRLAGLQVTDTATLIHNPRLVSTMLFVVLRRLLGDRADGVIAGLLKMFGFMERLPTRRLTACFFAACADKPAAGAVLPSS